jgi:histone H3/H4
MGRKKLEKLVTKTKLNHEMAVKGGSRRPAKTALYEAVNEFSQQLIDDAAKYKTHAKRKQINKSDIELAKKKLMGN